LRLSLRLIPLLFGMALLASACSRVEPWQRTDEMVVAILDDPVFYQSASADGEVSGFEYDLIRAFADEMKLKVRFVPAQSNAQLRELMAEGIVRFSAAAPIRPSAEYRYTQTLREAQLLIVQHADEISLDETEDLVGHTIEVSADGPAEQVLKKLPVIGQLTVKSDENINDLDLLAHIQERRSELAATDSAHLNVATNYYPDLAVAQEIPGKVAYGWAFRFEDEALCAQADAFITRFKQDGRLARLEDRYFGHINRITPIATAQFIQDMRNRLPRFRSDFQKAQTLTGIDWRLLAALAYQESKWDPLATSYTGVRGLMMLTGETADRMHVSNRLDPQESILAGARYLADLIDELPDEIKDPDRQWLGLAAYNLGMGHLNGARRFAIGLKRDPTSWYDMKSVLPLMARPEYYARLKAGRARGGEAVVLVENVRTYFDILARFEPVRHSPLQTGLAMQ
jgi:membrane-bound lytic murein transglycosylase F